MTTLHLGKSIGRSPWRRGCLLFALAWFALSPAVRAVSPPPDGVYANGNTAEGTNALFSLTTGFQNTANGFDALFHNTTGFQNVANGFEALVENTSGFHNTANGFEALLRNTTGNHNTANGDRALEGNTTGNDNTTDGAHSLGANTTGSRNIALGFGAGANLTMGNDNIDIGNAGVVGEANTIRVGTHGMQIRTFIAGIGGTAVTGSPVVVDASGQLGVAPSSARFKADVEPMNKASEAILALKPVSFHYKKEIDPDRTPQFGLVAEQVERVNPDLVVSDAQGKPYTVRYEAVNAMLLNEFLKEHRKVQEQDATIAQLKLNAAKQETTVAHQQKQIEALTAGLQKVNDQLELSKPAPQTVLNNQ